MARVHVLAVFTHVHCCTTATDTQTALGKAALSDTATCRPLYGEQRCIIQTEHSTAGDTSTCRPLYGEQRCIIQTEHSTAGDTSTCPLYGEQRCIIQTEHSTAGDTSCRPLYGEQRCIIQTEHSRRYINMSPALRRAALYNTDSSLSSCTLLCPQRSTDIQHFHTAAPAYITLWYRDITELETFQNCLAGSAQRVSRMCCFVRQRPTIQCRLLLFPPPSGSLGTYMTANRHTLINLSLYLTTRHLFPSALCRSPRVLLCYTAVNTGLLLATFTIRWPKCFPSARRHAPYPNTLFRAPKSL